jgi:O-antigen/teichoic acid export membrane protein
VSTARRVARNTAVQFAGELVSKGASIAFYIVMARTLDVEGFGEFNLALSIALLCTVFAGFGLDAILTTEMSREPERLRHVFWNAIAAKAAFGLIGIAAALAITVAGGYRAQLDVAVFLLAVAAVIELIAKTLYATFQAFDDMKPVATSLALQRVATAAIGIPAMLLGVDVVAVCAIYLLCALLTLAYAGRAMHRGIGLPNVWLSGATARALVRRSLPIGVATIFGAILFRVDATMLGLMKDDSAVGIYSSAYRLLESTLFVSYAFTAAALPTLSRLSPTTRPPIREAATLSVKAILAGLLPVGMTFALFAEPIISTLYGSDFDAATTSMRLLGGAAALYGVSYLGGYVLVGQQRQNLIPWIIGAVAVENIVLNFILIPSHSYNGAAAATSISEATLAATTLAFVIATVGGLGFGRVVAGPAAGAAAMGAVVAVAGATWWTLVPALVAFGLAFLAVERIAFASDLALARRLIRPAAGGSP